MADSTYILSKKFYLLSVKSASFTYFPSKGLSTGFHLFLYTPNFYSQFPKRAINHGQKVHKSYTSIYRILNFAVHLIGFKPETKSKLRWTWWKFTIIRCINPKQCKLFTMKILQQRRAAPPGARLAPVLEYDGNGWVGVGEGFDGCNRKRDNNVIQKRQK